MSDPQMSGKSPVPLAEVLAGVICHTQNDHHVSFLAGRARWAEAGHRRLLHAMRELRLNPDSGFKSARVLLVTSWVNITCTATPPL